jgi:hypothetical protein
MSYRVTILLSLVQFRYSMSVVDSIVAKYLASVVGWLTVSRPFLNLDHPRYKGASPAVLYQVRVVVCYMLYNDQIIAQL